MIFESQVAAFLIATTAGLTLSVVSFFVARRSGLSPVQGTLVSTLQDTTEALKLRVEQLETEVSGLRKERESLAETVKKLREAVSDLAAENVELRRQLKMPSRTLE